MKKLLAVLTSVAFIMTMIPMYASAADEEMVEISGTVIWNDGNDLDGARPDVLKVELLSGDEVIDTRETGIEWTYDFGSLPSDGEYSISVDDIEGYVTSYGGYDVVNTRVEDLMFGHSIFWDEDNAPDEIKAELLADGIETGMFASANKDNDWTYYFQNVVKYNQDGSEIEYSIREIDPPVEEDTPSYEDKEKDEPQEIEKEIIAKETVEPSIDEAVEEAYDTPETGNKMLIILWAGVIIGVIGLVAVVVLRRRVK